MDTRMNKNKLNDAVMYNRIDEVRAMISSGMNFDIEDLKNACISAAGYGFVGVLEAIFSDNRFWFLAPEVLWHAARMNKVEVLEYLLTLNLDKSHCISAFEQASEKGHTEACNILQPFC